MICEPDWQGGELANPGCFTAISPQFQAAFSVPAVHSHQMCEVTQHSAHLQTVPYSNTDGEHYKEVLRDRSQSLVFLVTVQLSQQSSGA